jgi:ketosteroid isomerase-like protein
MSQTEVETIQRAYDAWNGEEGILGALSLFDPDIEFVNPESAIEAGTHHGHAGMVAALDSVDAAFSDYVHEPEQLIDAGDKVLALVTFRARGRDSGVPVEIPEQHVWTFHGGKIVRFQWFHDQEQARRAAGL